MVHWNSSRAKHTLSTALLDSLALSLLDQCVFLLKNNHGNDGMNIRWAVPTVWSAASHESQIIVMKWKAIVAIYMILFKGL